MYNIFLKKKLIYVQKTLIIRGFNKWTTWLGFHCKVFNETGINVVVTLKPPDGDAQHWFLREMPWAWKC